MALRMKGRGVHGLDQLEYDIFWTEYRAIEESRPNDQVPEEEHEEDPPKEPPCGMYMCIKMRYRSVPKKKNFFCTLPKWKLVIFCRIKFT